MNRCMKALILIFAVMLTSDRNTVLYNVKRFNVIHMRNDLRANIKLYIFLKSQKNLIISLIAQYALSLGMKLTLNLNKTIRCYC